MTIVQSLAHLFGPWQSLYGDSKTVAAVVNAVHLTGLLFGGGLAVAADRTTLRALKGERTDRARALAELGAVHRPVLLALAVLFLSGVALAGADVETFAASPIFWVKLGVVALLLLNGAVLARTEHELRRMEPGEPGRARLWHRLRVATYLSVGLWTATVIAGTVLVNAA